MGRRLRASSLCRVVILVLLLGAGAPESAGAAPALGLTPVTPDSVFQGPPRAPAGATPFGRGTASVIVTLEDDAVASYAGRVPGLGATSPSAVGRARLDVRGAATLQYRAYLKAKHDAFAAAAARAIRGAVVVHRFDLVLNGVSMLVPADRVASLRALPGVKAVYADRLLRLHTDRSPEFVGAPALWTALGGAGSAGEGAIVGVLDTGVWPEHPSFSDPDPLGKPYAAPPPPLAGTRACAFAGGANPGAPFSCNNKLIGARRFMATYEAVRGLTPGEYTTARDDDGHGTHTASTAAGNGGVAASIQGHALGTVSGIAPRAHVIAYKVCGATGCFASDSAAAVQQAIQDGVDVINFSISGGEEPYRDAVELAFLDAYAAGVFVAASAGNDGPTSDTVNHRGPWVATVGGVSSNRQFDSTATLTAGSAVLSVTGSGMSEGVAAAAPLVSAATLGNAGCQTAFAPGAVTGMVVVCNAFGNRLLKSLNVAQGGGAGMVIQGPETVVEFVLNHWVPTVHLAKAESDLLVAFLAANTGITASISPGAAALAQGDRMYVSSSRGGATLTGVSKPDVAAPAVRILAGDTPAPAVPPGHPVGDLFQVIEGTSMASPHVAGAAALLRALHPTWTPGQIKSALMTTARTVGVVKEDGTTAVTPFDVGAGRIDLTRAGDPGLTFDVPDEKYRDLADRLWETNHPSAYVPGLADVITLRRTGRSQLGQESTWTARVASAPPDLQIAVPAEAVVVPPGAKLALPITIDARTAPLGAPRHAAVEVTDGVRTARLPITIVRGASPLTLAKACAPTSLAFATSTTCTVTIANPSLDDAAVSLIDALPSALRLIPGSVTGGGVAGQDAVTFTGGLSGAARDVVVAPGASPFGYLPLSGLGASPVSGAGDETIHNFTVPSFVFGGQAYTRIALVSNGYAILGGGSAGDVSPDNQHLPDASAPNNVLAPFWTDLDPAAGGAVRAAVVNSGTDRWLVLDWEAVREFSSAAVYSFQIWIGLNGTEDVSFTYGAIGGDGDQGRLTVGAENGTGNRGANVYVDGTGTLPGAGTELRVSTGTAPPGESRTITYQATAVSGGTWASCAELTSDRFVGARTACVDGVVAGHGLTALGSAKVWVGLGDGAALTRIDLAAEVRLGPTLIGSGELRNVFALGGGFPRALLRSIPLELTSGPVEAPSGGIVSITLTARRACAAIGRGPATVRLWYDGTPADTGRARDAGSRFGAMIDQASRTLYLRSGSALTEGAGASRTSVDAAVTGEEPCAGAGRPYTVLGTWTATLP